MSKNMRRTMERVKDEIGGIASTCHALYAGYEEIAARGPAIDQAGIFLSLSEHLARLHSDLADAFDKASA